MLEKRVDKIKQTFCSTKLQARHTLSDQNGMRLLAAYLGPFKLLCRREKSLVVGYPLT
jgi:hypothetical protein